MPIGFIGIPTQFTILFRIGDLLSKDGPRTGGRSDHAEQHFDGGAFAGAISAQKRGYPIPSDR